MAYRIYKSVAGKHTDYRAKNKAAGTGGNPVPIYQAPSKPKAPIKPPVKPSTKPKVYKIYKSKAGVHTNYRAINKKAGTGGNPVPIHHPATVPASYYTSARTKRLARTWKPSYPSERNPYIERSSPMPAKKAKPKVYTGARGGRYTLDRVTQTPTGRQRKNPKVTRRYL